MTLSTEVPTSLIPYSILESIKGDFGVSFSTLLNDKSLISRYPDISDFVQEVHKLLALKMINIVSELSEEEGEDFRINLTERGEGILKTIHE